MRIRVFILLVFLVFYVSSCSYFSSEAKPNIQQLDSIINFTKVDVSPSFKVCDKLIEEAKTKCFRANIHQQMTKYLKASSFATKQAINEEVEVILLINKKGKITLQEVKSSEMLQQEIPDLITVIKTSIDSFPKLTPASKRGIPVATQYTLPIRIQTK